MNLTEKECKKALENLKEPTDNWYSSELQLAENNDEPIEYKHQESLDIIEQLINEHFDNPEEHLKDKEIKKNNKSNKDFVYIVFSGCVGDIGVDAVFKTEDAAKQYIKMNAELYEPFYGKYEVLEEYQPKKEQYLTYNVGFINPNTKKEDETQFDVYDFSEISKLFTDFARENHWYNNPKIIYVEQIDN